MELGEIDRSCKRVVPPPEVAGGRKWVGVGSMINGSGWVDDKWVGLGFLGKKFGSFRSFFVQIIKFFIVVQF